MADEELEETAVEGDKKPEDFVAPRNDRQPIMTPEMAEIIVKVKIGGDADLAKDTGLMKYILGIKIADYAKLHCHPHFKDADFEKMRKEFELWIDLASKIPLAEAIRYNENAVDIFRDRAINQAMNVRSFRKNVEKQEFKSENEARIAHAAGQCDSIEEGIAYQLVREENSWSEDKPLNEEQKMYFYKVREECQEELDLIKGLIPEDSD